MMAKLKIYPTREYLLECFDYKKENGELFWKRRPSSHFDGKTEWRVFNSRFTGKLAGCGCCDGRRVSVGKTIFFRHILIFIIETGRPPKNRLVKINGDFGDDRFSNLDIRNNGSVIRHTSGNFDAITTSNGKQSYAGRFSNPDDAQHKLAEIKEQIRKGHYVKKIRSAKNGFYGVRISAKGEIKAEIKVNGKKHNLGVFKSKQEASSAYQNAKKKNFRWCVCRNIAIQRK